MKRLPVFAVRFALAPMVSGTFAVSMSGRASWIEWAHTVTGYAAIYLILGMVLVAVRLRRKRLPAFAALVLALLEALPGMPRLHAAISPVLFATLAWAAVSLPAQNRTLDWRTCRVFALPALVLLTIFYGVGYRHQTSGFLSHAGAAMVAAGVLLVFCMIVNQRYEDDGALRGVANLTMAVVIFQLTAGFAAFVIRMLELEGGLALALARTAHITGAAPLLAASTTLAIQYRRSAHLKSDGPTAPAQP